MRTTLQIFDPYRNRVTTLREFATLEGCPKHAAAQFFRRHKTLQGFRQRPARHHNGIAPHTYTRNGEYIPVSAAARLAGLSTTTLRKYSLEGITDIAEIKKEKARRQAERGVRYPIKPGCTETLASIAARTGSTTNAVYLYFQRHGTLEGFASRMNSRVNPKLYPHNALGVAKSAKDWAAHFDCDQRLIYKWVSQHGGNMDGFESRRAWTRRDRYRERIDDRAAS